jgi:hypothetical protein
MKPSKELYSELESLQIEINLANHYAKTCMEHASFIQNDQEKLKKAWNDLLTKLSRSTFLASNICDKHDL